MYQGNFRTKRVDQPILTLQRVSKLFRNGQRALSEITLRLMPGEMLFISGQSGSGKSTLLKLCGLLDTPTSGEIFFRGQNIDETTSRQKLLLRRTTGFVSQQPKFIHDQSIFNNLAMPLVIAGLRPQEIKRRVDEMLENILLSHSARIKPSALSSGEQACLGIARALISYPSLVIADEPTGQIDPQSAQRMFDLLLQANKFGVSLLMATHDLNLIARSKARALFLEDGYLAREEYL